MKCKDCKFFNPDQFGAWQMGLCRRYPSGLKVKEVNWCGEFTKKVATKKKQE
jgi:hypothetical protein